jgi:hypothetical protein
MRNSIIGCALAGVLACAAGAEAQPRTKDAASGAGSDVSPMSVEDYLVDKSSIKGVVAVKGSVGCMGADTCFLYGANVMSSATFNTLRLPREDRKRLLSCDVWTDPCIVTIVGQNHPTEIMAAIDANRIIWQPNEEDIAAADPTLPPCSAVSADDIRGLVEASPLAGLTHITIAGVKIDTVTDREGHVHCTAEVVTNAGEKKFRFHLKHQDQQVYIVGN